MDSLEDAGTEHLCTHELERGDDTTYCAAGNCPGDPGVLSPTLALQAVCRTTLSVWVAQHRTSASRGVCLCRRGVRGSEPTAGQQQMLIKVENGLLCAVQGDWVVPHWDS